MPRKKTNLSLHHISRSQALELARWFNYSISEVVERLLDQAHRQEKRIKRRSPSEHLQLKLFDPKLRPKARQE